MNNACILSIGDELTSGLTLNTNSLWLSQHLTALGIPTLAHVTVADDLPAITRYIKELTGNGRFLLMSGGLGPTEDDLTRQALAAALGDPLVQDDQALLQLHAWFKSRGRVMSASNAIQAQRPASATCLPNPLGTAPGLRAAKGDCIIFAMPGVPPEMKQMFTVSVLPELQSAAGDQVTLTVKLNTYGIGESILGERIKDLMTRGGNPMVGTSVHDGVVSVRIYATGSRDTAQAMIDRVKTEVHTRLGPLIFGEDACTLEASLAELLLSRQQTIATAESCTGGLMATLLTNIPGSSAYFMRGWVTYTNRAKTEEVEVPANLIAQHGAVSQEVALAMATGARRIAQTDWSLAITGIAGPGGGSEQKPVGLVWIALAGPNGTEARRFIFAGDRTGIRIRAAHMALALLRWKIFGLDPSAVMSVK